MRIEKLETPHGPDYYALMTTNEIPSVVAQHAARLKANCNPSWMGQTWSEFQRCVVVGDESRVEQSERLLREIEDQVPMSRGWRNVDDVVGAVPNIPAFLAGHPQHMRRRERVARDNAPLTLYADLTSSASISSYDVGRRGVALLALVRLLCEHRPVELWVGTSQDMGRGSGTVAWRVDTAPLDLARAAQHVAATAMSRLFGYGVSHLLHNTGGGWPFHNHELHVRTGRERLQTVFGGEVLYVPSIYVGDPMTRDPVGWVRRVMSKYVNVNNGE